jgi:hypothetical protein
MVRVDWLILVVAAELEVSLVEATKVIVREETVVQE